MTVSTGKQAVSGGKGADKRHINWLKNCQLMSVGGGEGAVS